MQAKAAALNTKKVFDLLLAMESNQEEAPSWDSLTIETYPRNAVPDLDNASAEAKMSAWVAGMDGSLGSLAQSSSLARLSPCT